MQDQLKLEIDRLHRTMNVLREAVTKLQQDKAQQQREIDDLRNWASGFVGTLRQHHAHQKAEVDELYRCAEAAAHKIDFIGRELIRTIGHADLALHKLYPKQLAFEEEVAKIIGDPALGKDTTALPNDPDTRTKS